MPLQFGWVDWRVIGTIDPTYIETNTPWTEGGRSTAGRDPLQHIGSPTGLGNMTTLQHTVQPKKGVWGDTPLKLSVCSLFHKSINNQKECSTLFCMVFCPVLSKSIS